MLETNPRIIVAAIWEHLADEHGANIAYPTLRTYVSSKRGQESVRGSD
jgi:hypothetical protein